MAELEVRSSKETTYVNALRSTHEEADTRLMLHSVHSQFKTAVVSSRVTDVLLLLVSHFPLVQCEPLWMMSGTSKKRRYMPIVSVFNNLPRNSYTALIPLNALTGYDITSCFANQTKQSSLKVFKEHHNPLKNLGIGRLKKEIIKYVEAFVCRMYNVHRTDSVVTARHMLFSKTYINQKQCHRQVMLFISIRTDQP